MAFCDFVPINLRRLDRSPCTRETIAVSAIHFIIVAVLQVALDMVVRISVGKAHLIRKDEKVKRRRPLALDEKFGKSNGSFGTRNCDRMTHNPNST